MAHRFQHLSTKRIPQAREEESISASVQARHLAPWHMAEEHDFVHGVKTPGVLLPSRPHCTIASNE
jgi:hypothetical protein